MSKSTTLVTTTTVFSQITSAIRQDAEKSGKFPSKQRMLNTAAKYIAGDKHDWSYLTGASGPVIQKGLPEARLNDLRALDVQKPQQAPQEAAQPLLVTDASKPQIVIEAKTMSLYNEGDETLTAKLLTGDILAVSEEYAFDLEYGQGLQAMLNPGVIVAAQDGTLNDHSLYLAQTDIKQKAGAAYFSATAHGHMNGEIMEIIEGWHDDLEHFNYKSIHLSNALILMPENPFKALRSIGSISEGPGNSKRNTQPDWSKLQQDTLQYGYKVFLQEGLDPKETAKAAARVENFLIRLARMLHAPEPFHNVCVSWPGKPASSARPTRLQVTSHVYGSITHGGYDDAPSLSLWIDEEKGVAHLLGHSGSIAPLSGPSAPAHAPQFEVIGKAGHVTIFGEEDIEQARRALESLFDDHTPGLIDRYTDQIESILGDFVHDTVSYETWTKENDPETYAELYADQE